MLNGLTHCVYPPCVSLDVDVTRQVGDQGERYVIRNRATLRYFLLKPLEFHFFQQFDGTRNLADIMQGSLSGTTPRVSKSALVKFLSKCDAYGLLQYQGGQALP